MTVSVVWRRAVALVAGAHVGAFEVGTGTIGADVWFQAFVYVLGDVA